MDENPEVILLYGDIGNKLFDPIKAAFPDRALNCGVAEANMVTVAAGLASVGFRPFVYTISSFLYLKALEQIKLDLCHPSLAVTLVGTGGGLSYSSLGTTHHSLEDFAVLGALPNISLYNPADSQELEACLEHLISNSGPTWLRLGKKGEPDLPIGPIPFEVGSPIGGRLVFGDGRSETAILGTGVPVFESAAAAEVVKSMGLAVDVWSIPQLKPFPFEQIRREIGRYKSLVVVEEHVPSGGLASLVQSTFWGLMEPEITTLNSGDRFHFATGEPAEARKSIHQTRGQIVDLLLKMLPSS